MVGFGTNFSPKLLQPFHVPLWPPGGTPASGGYQDLAARLKAEPAASA